MNCGTGGTSRTGGTCETGGRNGKAERAGTSGTSGKDWTGGRNGKAGSASQSQRMHGAGYVGRVGRGENFEF